MAEIKKATAKVIAKEADKVVKTAEPVVKEEPKKAEVKAEVKKAPVKKAAAEKKAPAAKKPAAPKKAEKKVEVKETVNFQFRGKSYTPEDLLNICKDVWKYDLNGKEEDFKSVELYVKPEENTTYYVINGNITGSFFI